MVECGGGASGAPWSPRSPEATGCDRATAFPLYAPRACRRARFPRHPRKERKPPCGGSVLSVSAAALLFCRSCAGSVQGQRPVHSKGLAPNAPRVRSSGRLGAFSAGAFSPVALFCRLLSVFAPPHHPPTTHDGRTGDLPRLPQHRPLPVRRGVQVHPRGGPADRAAEQACWHGESGAHAATRRRPISGTAARPCVTARARARNQPRCGSGPDAGRRAGAHAALRPRPDARHLGGRNRLETVHRVPRAPQQPTTARARDRPAL
jgi:hypothetical protein